MSFAWSLFVPTHVHYRGFVDVDDIADKYNAKTNPDVMSGKKTEKQVLKEFLDTFDQRDRDGKVYPDEFCK